MIVITYTVFFGTSYELYGINKMTVITGILTDLYQKKGRTLVEPTKQRQPFLRLDTQN